MQAQLFWHLYVPQVHYTVAPLQYSLIIPHDTVPTCRQCGEIVLPPGIVMLLFTPMLPEKVGAYLSVSEAKMGCALWDGEAPV